MERPIINKESLIPLGLVITLVGAAMSFGVMYQKVETVRADLVDVKNQITKLDDKLDAVLTQRSVANR